MGGMATLAAQKPPKLPRTPTTGPQSPKLQGGPITDTAALLAELAPAKAAFQQRTILDILTETKPPPA